MYIEHLKLENFKNFGEISVAFQPGVNLLVGTNGSGKTSILEAINVAVGGFFASQEQKMQRAIEFDEIKITRREGQPFPVRELSTAVIAKSPSIGEWTRTISSKTKTNSDKGLKAAADYGAQFFKAFDTAGDEIPAPLISYYSTQRLFKDSSQSAKQKFDPSAGRRNGYLQCLKEPAIKQVLNDWLGKAVTLRATKQIKDIISSDLIVDNVDSAIRKTLIRFNELPDNFALKIYQNPFFENELFIQYDKEHDLPISYYSDGFRNLIFLIIDLVWRASQLNPWMSLEQISTDVTGVVTIDEIDLHLHPKWQSKAIRLLQDLFPKVQFFITTHSPTVVANFENGTLYIIADDQICVPQEKYFGRQIDAVLRDVLGATDRNVATQKKVDLLLRLIDENASEQEINQLLSELTNLIGIDDAEIQQAISLWEWKKFNKVQTDAVHI